MDKPADLIKDFNKLDDWLTAENKRYAEHIKPAKERMEAIKQQLLTQLIELGSKDKQSIATDHGTAYTSTITTPKVADRDKYLDFINDNWAVIGDEMLQLGAPQVTAVKGYMEQNEGHLPPGVEISTFTRVNIKRS